jgi:hypothetical protein
MSLDLWSPSGVFREDAWSALVPQQGFVHDYVKHYIELTDAYAPYHVVVALSALSSIVHPDLKANFNAVALYPNIYAMVVGAAGHERKSHCVDLGTVLLRDAVPGREMSQPGSRESFIEMMIQREQETVSNGSVQGVAQALIPYPEFAGFLHQSVDVRGHLGPLKSEYLNAWGCSPLSRPVVESVKKKRVSRCERPRVSILVAIATPLLEKHSTWYDWTGGFFSRFIIVFGERIRDKEPGLGLDETSFRSLSNRLRDLASLPFVGRCIGFEDDAKAMWSSFTHQIGLEQRKVSRDDKSSSVLSRLAPTALKVALLYAYDLGHSQQQEWKISSSVLAPAINVAWVHLVSARHLIDRICDGKDQRDMQLVLDSVGPEGATLRDILNGSKLMKRRALEVLETLRERGLLNGAANEGGRMCYRHGASEEPAPGPEILN